MGAQPELREPRIAERGRVGEMGDPGAEAEIHGPGRVELPAEASAEQEIGPRRGPFGADRAAPELVALVGEVDRDEGPQRPAEEPQRGPGAEEELARGPVAVAVRIEAEQPE